MWILQTLAWGVALYFAGGVITMLALRLIDGGTPEPPNPTTPGDRREGFLSSLKLFLLWPSLWIIAGVFAAITIATKREIRQRNAAAVADRNSRANQARSLENEPPREAQ
jgi:hypothetical protein